MKSIIQDWVAKLGLRHQGVLMAAVRGCDTLSKNHPIKDLTRCYRAMVMHSHCGDPTQAVSFMKVFDEDEFEVVISQVTSDFDNLPVHYLLHFLHACEIIGYYHPDAWEADRWMRFYYRMVRKMHLQPETKQQLDDRLNASEDEFRILQTA